MKIKTLAALGAVLVLAAVFTQAGPLGTAFTYQGRLADGGILPGQPGAFNLGTRFPAGF